MSNCSRLQALASVLFLAVGLTSIANPLAPRAPLCGPATATIWNGSGKNPKLLIPVGVPQSHPTFNNLWTVNVNVDAAGELANTIVYLYIGRECLPYWLKTAYGEYLIKNELGYPTIKQKVYPGNNQPVTWTFTIPPNLCAAHICLQALVKPTSPIRPKAFKAPYWTNAISGFTGA